jgi:hypothetical protein
VGPMTSADGHVWMTATACDDGFDTQDQAEQAMDECEASDPSFRFRIVATAFGAYWRTVYGDKSASQLCSEYGLTGDDLTAWVTNSEVEAARQGNFANWQAIQAEWNALGFSKHALTLLQEAEEAIYQASGDAVLEGVAQ